VPEIRIIKAVKQVFKNTFLIEIKTDSGGDKFAECLFEQEFEREQAHQKQAVTILNETCSLSVPSLSKDYLTDSNHFTIGCIDGSGRFDSEGKFKVSTDFIKLILRANSYADMFEKAVDFES
jgi:hypothetical protein